jgi:hypothetical protein
VGAVDLGTTLRVDHRVHRLTSPPGAVDLGTTLRVDHRVHRPGGDDDGDSEPDISILEKSGHLYFGPTIPILLPIAPRHALGVRDLPPHHRDPFDRLLIATALAEGCPIVSKDSAFGWISLAAPEGSVWPPSVDQYPAR